ncbi:murein hydrolase activator EnvC family protein [Aureimonas sp. AU40]|uniref:murein hydrolase activator EnvC family protein n=1 Tax=Aureimonas sp. AU40 TaxID=1637747 RepID=UPI0007844439|nr:peptidoglycan DD-metalloendopeptidase family protein [Aureimonas sp. AU40]
MKRTRRDAAPALRVFLSAMLCASTGLAAFQPAFAREGGDLDPAPVGSILLSRGPDGEISASQDIGPHRSRAEALAAERARTEADLRRLGDEITLSKETAARIDREVAALQADRQRIRTAMIEAAAEQKRLSGEVSKSEDRIGQLGEEEGRLKVSLRERRGVLAEVLGALQRMGRKPPPALLVRPDDALGSVRSAILLGAVVPEIRAETDKLRGDLERLVAVRQQLSDEKTRFADALARTQEEEARLSRLFEEKQKLEAEGRGRIGEETRRAAELGAKATTLQDLIASLEGEAARAREIEERERLAAELARRAAEAAASQASKEAPAGGETATPPAASGKSYDIAALKREMTRLAPSAAFSTLKGSLVRPVAGRETGRFGQDNGTGRQASGETFASRVGDVVTSPSDATVLYSAPFRSYGQLLILDAGDGYHIVLAGMGRIDVSVGQTVLAGEPLATMGAMRVASAAKTDMSSAEPSLYVEFRKDGKPVDPTPWWTDGSSGRTRNDT